MAISVKDRTITAAEKITVNPIERIRYVTYSVFRYLTLLGEMTVRRNRMQTARETIRPTQFCYRPEPIADRSSSRPMIQVAVVRLQQQQHLKFSF